MDRNKIIGRVKRLYAMAQQEEASPHEAGIALKRCNSLMREHGITLLDLEGSKVTETAAQSNHKRCPQWIRMLHSSVASFHDCLAIVSSQDGNRFVGMEIDALSATLTFDYLLSTLERLVKREQGLMNLDGAKQANQYRLGFAAGIGIKVKDIINERKRQQRESQCAEPRAGDGRGLILVDAKRMKIKDHLGPLKKHRAKSKSIIHDRSLDKGLDAARAVSLNTQVDQKEPPKTLEHA